MSRSLHKITVRKNEKYAKSGMKSYVWLLHKYSLTPTQESPFYRDETTPITHNRKAAKKPVGRLMKKVADGNAVPTTTEDVQHDNSYLTEVEIKGQKHPFQLDFDTGSSDLWILGQDLAKQHPAVSSHHLFDKSIDFTPIPGAHFYIPYGDGSFAKGSVGQVGTADLSVGGLLVKAQAVEIANQVDQSFITGAGDGLLGLAWGSINSVSPTQVHTPVENMIAQKDIAVGEELFTAKLGSWRDANDPDHGESFYTFGYIDPATLAAGGGSVWYAPLVHNNADGQDGFWRFESSSMVVNGKTIARPSGNTAIADTGTTLGLIDDATLKHLYAQIPGAHIDAEQGAWVYPMGTTLEQLPTLSFDVGGKQFVVQKEDIGFDAITDQDGTEWVYGSFQSRGADSDFDILGDAFLKSVYAVFDLGFAQEDGSNGRFGAVARSEFQQNISEPTTPQ